MKFIIMVKKIRSKLFDLRKKLIIFWGPERIWKCRAINAVIIKNIVPYKTRIHFITFYSQGGEDDNGLDLSREVAEFIRKVRPFVDSAVAISVNQLRNNPSTAIYVKEFEEEAIWNVKTNKIGFLRWKPYIILQELKKLNDGDVLFYRDCNITKYPNILADVHNIRRNSSWVLNYLKEDIFVPIENYPNLKIKHNVKVELLKKAGVLNERNIERYLHNASLIICRKTTDIIDLMEEWLYYCMCDRLLLPTASEVQHLNFLHNTQEQAILNVILIKKGYTNYDNYTQPLGLSMVNRLFSLKNLIVVPRVAVLYCGQLRNFDNNDLLAMNVKNILGLYNCDIFASVWDERGFSYHHGDGSPKEYSKINDISLGKIVNLLGHSGCTVRSVEIENFDSWMAQQNDNIIDLYHKGMNFRGKVVKATSFPQLYKIYRANNLKSEFERRHNFKYDLVIRMRPDMGFVEAIPDEFFIRELMLKKTGNNIYHLNPQKIYYPKRIYDIFFWGGSIAMDRLCDSWNNIDVLLKSPFDNGLPVVDCCRLLYIQAKLNKLDVTDIGRCIGDIYRDETIGDYLYKIRNEFN